MKAGECNLQKILNGAVQFKVPIYQRKYSWKEEQCKQLWNDIIAASEKEVQSHFIGSIVYIDMGTPLGRPQQFSLIDGQQRLTTLSVLLIALARIIDERSLQGEVCKSTKLMNYFMLNQDEVGYDQYKLALTEQDMETYTALLSGKEKNLINKSMNILSNFNFFYKKLSDNKELAISIFKGVNNLMLVSIALDKAQDNPQLIFESMNSTGKDLTGADLIRNYVLMGHDKDVQEKLYNNYWRPMEQNFGPENYEKYFDMFIRDYLTSQSNSGKIPKIGEVYGEFKNYLKNSNKTIEEVLQLLLTYSKYYCAIQLGKENDEKINKLWNEMKAIDMSVSYPLIMRFYDDYIEGVISKDEFIKIIKITISYVVRRSICDIPTNSLNKTFATFYQNIDKKKYILSVLIEYVLKETYREFPNDDDFIERFRIKEIYRMKNRNYILEYIENYGHKEPISISEYGYSIEHIMPQDKNLISEWKNMLGENYEEIQGKYLHTIGNLTITGYNSEMGNRSFQYKRDSEKGFKNSHLMLNKDIAKLDIWNKDEIEKRAEFLSKMAINIWSYPDVSKEEIEDYKRNKETKSVDYSMKDYALMSEGIKEIFEEIEEIIIDLEYVSKDFNKHYIAYKVNNNNFANIKPGKNHITIALNIPFKDINDPESQCMDYRDKGNFASCEVLINVDENTDIDKVNDLILQSYTYQE